MWLSSSLHTLIAYLLLLTSHIAGQQTSLNANEKQWNLIPDIRADTNRDGIVDVEGDSDAYGKSTWSAHRGAIFLPNVGDKHLRCPHEDLAGNPLSNRELVMCNDASGDMLLAPEYLAPLRTVPMVDISDAVVAHVYATPRAAYERVRIFQLINEGDPNATESWKIVDDQVFFNATQLRKGLVLGIDGREFVTDAQVWDGHVLVNFDVFESSGSSSYVRDSVAMKVAPVLMHHHLQHVKRLVSAEANANAKQEYFLEQLDAARENAGIEDPLFLFNQTTDIWAQDFLEPAYVSMLSPNGPVSLRIMLRSAQSGISSGRQVVEQLRGPGVGVFAPEGIPGLRLSASGFGYHTINSLGNLETIPPYTSKEGVVYKAGRVIQGKQFEDLPAQFIRNLIDGQGMQNTLFLETGWLKVGHVDEFVQFVPYANELGFTVAIASPRAALDILSSAQVNGHGSTKAISFDPQSQTHRFHPEEIPTPPFLDETIESLLKNTTFREVNTYAQRWIDHNLNILLSDIPLSPSDIIEIPALYHDTSPRWPATLPPGSDYYWPPVREGEYQVEFFWPGAINGIVAGEHYIAPRPFGPVVAGVDIIGQAVERAYGRAGMGVIFVDDYLSHHLGSGEVHCGSNALREVDFAWWR